MKCVIPGRFVKLFGRSIHCLAKIGDELYIEATNDGLALRTVNSSRSAFGCFFFHESFFCEYESKSANGDSPEDIEETQKWKITMKSCLGVFKSLNAIEKNVDMCKLEYDHKETRVVFKLFCKHGIVKTHNLTFQDSESLQAVFSRDLNPNLIVSQAKVLIDTANNFPHSCEEVTLGCSAENLNLKNYLEDEPDPSKVVHTEMKLHPDEFDTYQIGVDTDITFCLKEARAILSFSEFVSQPINIHFSSGGKPVVFSLDGDSLYTADFVLATLMDPSVATYPCQEEGKLATTFEAKKPFKRNQKRGKRQKEKNMEKNDVNEDRSMIVENFEGRSFSTPPYRQSLNGTQNILKQQEKTSAKSTEKMQVDEEDHTSRSKNICLPSLGDSIHDQDKNIEQEAEDFLPSTPPSKKFKSLFFAPREKRQLHQTILASDTDEEES